ncbi:hypothetical protein Hanom_Chr10g00910611 [Helianthus anomalus]
MATRTRSHSDESTSSFTNQNLLKHPEKRAVIRLFDRSIRSDVSSEEWICFSSYPFSLGFRYPFLEFIMQFFRTTSLCFA